jgi:hypothetical protein
LPPEELGDLIKAFEKDSTVLREQIGEICYFMNGGLEWNSAWGLCFSDREMLIKIVNRRRKEQDPNGKDYM